MYKRQVELRRLFTESNLRIVTTFLIEAFKRRDEPAIHRLMRAVRPAPPAELSREFAELIKLFHPDRLGLYLKRISELESGVQSDEAVLPPLAAALRAVRSAGPRQTKTHRPPRPAPVDFDFEEEQHYGAQDFDESRESEWPSEEEADEAEYSEETRSFVEAVKLHEYGTVDVTYTPGVLHSMEGSLDLSDLEIDDLAGAEHCENLTSLNLSSNRIEDVSSLRGLLRLEELYLSDNQMCIRDRSWAARPRRFARAQGLEAARSSNTCDYHYRARILDREGGRI